MEAQSLNALNYLAFNPPQYPVNPAEQKQEPLILYISRVPGTRDIILSTFKPGVKNVTAEDVLSSLYYVHYELPSTSTDADLLPPQILHDDQVNRSDSDGHSERSMQIQRKPLPSAATPFTPQDEDLDSDSRAPPPPPHQEIFRLQLPAFDPTFERPSSGDITNTPPTSRARASTGPKTGEKYPIRGRAHSGTRLEEVLLPPEPKTLLTPSIIERKPLPANSAVINDSVGQGKYWQSDIYMESQPQLPPRPFGSGRALPPVPREQHEVNDSRNGPDSTYGLQQNDRAPSPRKSLQMQRTSTRQNTVAETPYKLALIRRDPGTRDQWTVGSISTRQSEPTQAVPQHPYTLSYPPIDVQLENTGYDKFKGTARISADDAAAALSALTGQNHGTDSSVSKENLSALFKDTSTASPPGIFIRKIEMGYYKSWTSSLKDKIHQIDQQGWKASGKNLIKGRPLSIDTSDTRRRASAPTETSDLAGMKPRGYTFTSPWSGQCEFVTGNTGRSLKCLHALPESGSYNPLVDGGGGDDSEGGGSPPRGTAAVISELRFNLPRAERTSRTQDASVGPHSNAQRIKGHFSKILGQGSTDSDLDDFEDDDDDESGAISPFEVNLGAEKAGGGNRGKRAKLGKLIIHGEGQKMLDLVVAANVGVWWGAWERTQS